jgi:hypothetical protein
MTAETLNAYDRDQWLEPWPLDRKSEDCARAWEDAECPGDLCLNACMGEDCVWLVQYIPQKRIIKFRKLKAEQLQLFEH